MAEFFDTLYGWLILYGPTIAAFVVAILNFCRTNRSMKDFSDRLDDAKTQRQVEAVIKENRALRKEIDKLILEMRRIKTKEE